MVKPLGMPGSRAFTLKGASAKNPVYLINYHHLDEWYVRAGNAGVDTYNYAHAGDKPAIGFSKAELDTLLDRTGLEVQRYTKGDQPGVSWVWLQNPSEIPKDVQARFKDKREIARFPAETQNWDGRKASSFSAIASRILGPALKREIVISVPHGYAKEYVPGKTFNIYIWSTPNVRTHGRDIRVPATIWGFKRDCGDAAFASAALKKNVPGMPLGIPLSDGEYVVADLYPDALYVHHDLVNEGTVNEMRIFAELMARVAKLVGNKEAWQEMVAAAEAEAKTARDRQLAEIVRKSIPKRLERRNTTVDAAKARAKILRRQYFDAERAVLEANNEKVEDVELVAQRFVDELERMRTGQVDLIEGVDVTPAGEMIINTGEIHVEHPLTKNVHKLGKFRIALSLETGEVRSIQNKDKAFLVGGRRSHSPHVFEDGTSICFGNIGAEVQSYVAHFEVEVVANLLVAFLQSVTPHGSYLARLEAFPIVAAKAAA